MADKWTVPPGRIKDVPAGAEVRCEDFGRMLFFRRLGFAGQPDVFGILRRGGRPACRSKIQFTKQELPQGMETLFDG